MWWALIGIGLFILIVGYAIYNNTQYLLYLHEKRELQRTRKKLFDAHYKYAHERYGRFGILWKEHQKVCPYGCDKR